MKKEEVNEYLKCKIGYTKDEEIDELRETYKNTLKISEINEEDFCNSVYAWFFDGSTGAAYYDYWLEKNWS